MTCVGVIEVLAARLGRCAARAAPSDFWQSQGQPSRRLIQ